MESIIDSSPAVELLKELKRQDTIPMYQAQQIQEVVDIIAEVFNSMIATLESNNQEQRRHPYIATNLLVHHTSIARSKQCILAYLLERLSRVSGWRWKLGVLPEKVKEALSTQELEFFSQYDKNLSEYMDKFDLDLTTDLTHPPKELFVEVRVLEDYGIIQTENGEVDLKKNNTLFIRRTEIEDYIKKGIVEHIPNIV